MICTTLAAARALLPARCAEQLRKNNRPPEKVSPAICEPCLALFAGAKCPRDYSVYPVDNLDAPFRSPLSLVQNARDSRARRLRVGRPFVESQHSSWRSCAPWISHQSPITVGNLRGKIKHSRSQLILEHPVRATAYRGSSPATSSPRREFDERIPGDRIQSKLPSTSSGNSVSPLHTASRYAH